MALSIGGNKGKSKSSTAQTMDQTTSTSLSDFSKGLITDRMSEIGGQTYQGLDPNAYKAYENPYTQEVINATTADINASRDEEANQQRAAMLARGALGSSDRRGVREAELAGRYDRTLATTIGGLRAQGFNQATGVAQTENSNKNQFDANTQARIDQLLALIAGNDRTSRTTGTSTETSKGSRSGMNLGFSYGGG